MPENTDGQTVQQLLLANSQNDASKPLIEQLTSNPLFTGGLGLAALAAVATAGRRALQSGAGLLYRRMLVDVEVTRNEDVYRWLLQWISTHQQARLNLTIGTEKGVQLAKGGIVSRLLERFTPGLHHLQFQTSKVTLHDGSSVTKAAFVPGMGRHIIRYKNAFIAIHRERQKGTSISSADPFESVMLTTLYSQRHVLNHLFQDARRLAQEYQEGKTIMYTAWMTEWKEFGQPKRKRPIESVVLEEGLKERILDDIQGFLQSRTWYLDRGIPYRRGYLLYGPPGTGKSSFIQALAGELNFNIATLNVAERGLTDDRLNHLLLKIPSRCLVLLEDADAAFVNRRQVGADGYSGPTVTFSGLLNALDGVASAEERIVFLTTNHVDKLDEALIRPGRIDMSVEIGYCTLYQISHLWDRFYVDSDSDGKLKAQFLQEVQSLGLVNSVSAASLQGLFLYNKDSPEGAISHLSSLVKSSQTKPKHMKSSA